MIARAALFCFCWGQRSRPRVRTVRDLFAQGRNVLAPNGSYSAGAARSELLLCWPKRHGSPLSRCCRLAAELAVHEDGLIEELTLAK